MKQITLGGSKNFEKHNRPTRKAGFLNRMNTPVPWSAFCALIEPHYPKAGKGRPPIGLERMLRMYFVANWFNLADEACEDALYDVAVFREFCQIDLGRERVPDATTLLKFRHLLEVHDLGAPMFAKVGELLIAHGMRLSGGTIVDATLIVAPPSTKNQDKARDPQMHQSKKGKEWYFGMKLHIGSFSDTGITHSASVTSGNVPDSDQLGNLLRGDETRLYGDSAYRGAERRERLGQLAPKAKGFTNKRNYRNRPLSEADRKTNRRKSSVRSKIEHTFLTLKRHWGFAKVRYRGLAKNANRAFAMLALINVNKWARPLTGKMCPA